MGNENNEPMVYVTNADGIKVECKTDESKELLRAILDNRITIRNVDDTVQVTGDTYELRDLLRDWLGMEWISENKMWVGFKRDLPDSYGSEHHKVMTKEQYNRAITMQFICSDYNGTAACW